MSTKAVNGMTSVLSFPATNTAKKDNIHHRSKFPIFRQDKIKQFDNNFFIDLFI